METRYQFGSHVLQYHEPLHLLHLNWPESANEEEYRALLQEMVRLTKVYQVDRWLLNMEHAAPMDIEKKSWLSDFMTSELAGTSISRIARVDSGSWVYEQDVRRLVADAHAKHSFTIQVKFFGSEIDALAWLADATPGDMD